MPFSCFSDPSEVPAPSSPRRMTTTHCLGYLADLNRMTYSACFSYPADLRRMTVSHCFSYSAGAPLGVGNRDAALPVLPGLRSMVFGTCFRY